MGEALTDYCDHGPMDPHLINSKHTKRPLPILVLLSESAQFGQNCSLSTLNSALSLNAILLFGTTF